MKRGSILITLIVLLIPSLAIAEGHRIGVGLGTTSGTFERYGQAVDLKGELLELPVYTYVSANGLMVGFRLMEFTVRGKETAGLNRMDFAYKQSLLAASLGIEIKIGDNFAITPQIVKSYLGSSRFHTSTHTTYTAYTSYPYEYVTATDTISGAAELSGWEVPVYWVGEYFLVGLKLASYTNRTKIDWPTGSGSEVVLTGALSLLLETRF
ncbi:MAG: hypothetical protein ABIK68_13450 [bacterium]